MKYAPKKVFILSDGEYTEITYEELRRLTEENVQYADKLFIPLHGMLMEVTKDTYRDFYKDKRRQKYLYELSKENREISYDMLTKDEFIGEDILIDSSKNIAAQVELKIMTDKLKKAILSLPEDDKLLICRHYYKKISEMELASLYGISQQAISKRIGKIRVKLKILGCSPLDFSAWKVRGLYLAALGTLKIE